MLRYHVAFYLPRGGEKMVVAEALDFLGVLSQGFDLADARLMVSSALEDMAQMLLEEQTVAETESRFLGTGSRPG
jgi:hypothetical protein